MLKGAMETFKKLPLGGQDRRAIVGTLAQHGARVATELLAHERAGVRSAGVSIAPDAAVLILGGSTGITRSIAIQLLFGERTATFGVYYDSEKMQIGPHHVRAMTQAASQDGLTARFWNADATKPAVLAEVASALKSQFRAVHLINGIAAGATKRYAEHGPALVKDLDVAFHPILQTPDFSKPEHIRRVGFVEVEVATDTDIERTNRFMGSSSLIWAEALAEAGLLAAGESVVAFCDYDFEPDDPVYAMGPLSGAKKLQRSTMEEIRRRFGVRTARICYPPVATTALGAIPGGLLMYGMGTQILKEQGRYQDLPALAVGSMRAFDAALKDGEVRLDGAYQDILPEFHRREAALQPSDLPHAFRLLYA